jgi:archaellum component FlaC
MMPDGSINVKITAEASGFVGGVNQAKTSVDSLAQSVQAQTTGLNAATGGLQQNAQAHTGLAAAVNQSTAAHSTHAGAVQQAAQAHSAHVGALHQLREASEAGVEGLNRLGESAKHVAELFGIGLGIREVIEGIERLAEMGERMENTAAAIGMPVEEFSKLSGAMELAGGNADTARRSLILLQSKLVEAADAPGKARSAMISLGYSMEDIKKSAEDSSYAITRAAVAYAQWGNSAIKVTDFKELFGARGMQEVIAAIKGGGAAFENLKKEYIELTGRSEPVIKHLAETAESINRLKAAVTGVGISLYEEFRTPINTALDSLKEFARHTDEVKEKLREWSGAAAGAGLGFLVGGLPGALLGGFAGAVAGIENITTAVTALGSKIQESVDGWRQLIDAMSGPTAAEKAVQTTGRGEEALRRRRAGQEQYNSENMARGFGGLPPMSQTYDEWLKAQPPEERRKYEPPTVEEWAGREAAQRAHDNQGTRVYSEPAGPPAPEPEKPAPAKPIDINKEKEGLGERVKVIEEEVKAKEAYYELLKAQANGNKAEIAQIEAQKVVDLQKSLAAKRKIYQEELDALHKRTDDQQTIDRIVPAGTMQGIDTEERHLQTQQTTVTNAAQQQRFRTAEQEVAQAESLSARLIAIEKSKNDIRVTLHRETKAQAIANEQQLTDQLHQEIEKRWADEEWANAQTVEQKRKALDDKAKLEEDYAAKSYALYAKQVADVAKQNEQEVSALKQGFDQIGSAFEGAFKGLIDGSTQANTKVVQTMHVAANGVVFFTNTMHRQSALAVAGLKLLSQTGDAVANTLLKMGTEAAAKGLAAATGYTFKEGETPSLSGLFAKMVGGLFGLGEHEADKTPLTKADEALEQAGTALSDAAALQKEAAQALLQAAGKGGAAGSGTGGQAGPSATAAEHGGATTVSGAAPASTAEMTAYLQQKHGYDASHAASVIGQLTQESSLDPLSGLGTAHQGLAQWDATRFAALKKYAEDTGKNWKDWQTQLDFANQEIHAMTPEFFQAQGLHEQSDILTGGWEKPAKRGTANYDWEVSRRTALSERALPVAQAQSGTPVPVTIVGDQTAPQRSPSQTAAEHTANPASGQPPSTTPSEASVDAANQLKEAAEALKAAAAAQSKSEGTGATASASAPIPPLQEGGTVTSTGLALVHAGEIVLPPGTAIAETGGLPAGEEAGAAEASRMMQPAIGAIGQAIAEQAKEFGQAGANLGRAGLEAHADFMSGKEAEGPLLGFKPESGEITGRLPALAEQITSGMAGPVALPEVHVVERMEGVLERAHQAEKSAGTVSTGLRLGRAIGGVRGLDEAASSEAGTEGAAGDEHGIDLIGAAGDKLKSVAAGLSDYLTGSAASLELAAKQLPQAAEDIGKTLLGIGERAEKTEQQIAGAPAEVTKPAIDMQPGLEALGGLQTFALGGRIVPEAGAGVPLRGAGTFAGTAGRELAANEEGTLNLRRLVPAQLLEGVPRSRLSGEKFNLLANAALSPDVNFHSYWGAGTAAPNILSGLRQPVFSELHNLRSRYPLDLPVDVGQATSKEFGSGNAYAGGTYARENPFGDVTHRLWLNEKFFARNPGKLQSLLGKEFDSGYGSSPKPENVISHEWGHFLDWQMGGISPERLAQRGLQQAPGFSPELSELKAAGHAAAAPESYAKTSPEEWFAESFAGLRSGLGTDQPYVGDLGKFIARNFGRQEFGIAGAIGGGGAAAATAASGNAQAAPLSQQASAAPLQVDLEQIAGSSLTTPGTTSGGGLPVSSAVPPSAAATPAPAVPIPAPEPTLATGLGAPNASPSGEGFSSQLATLGPMLQLDATSTQTDATNIQANTTAVQQDSTAGQASANALKTSATSVGDNTTAVKSLTQSLDTVSSALANLKLGGSGSGSGGDKSGDKSAGDEAGGGDWSSSSDATSSNTDAAKGNTQAATSNTDATKTSTQATTDNTAAVKALTEKTGSSPGSAPSGDDGSFLNKLGGLVPSVLPLLGSAEKLAGGSGAISGALGNLFKLATGIGGLFGSSSSGGTPSASGGGPGDQGGDWSSSDVPAYASGGTVEETGLALVHKGEVIIPAADADSGHWASASPMAGYANPFHPIAQMIAGFFGQPMGDQFRGLFGAADPTDPDDPRRAPNWSSSANDGGGDWSSADAPSADTASLDSADFSIGGVVPSAAGGMVVSGGPQTVAPLGYTGSGPVGSPNTPGDLLYPTPPPVVRPQYLTSKPSTLTAILGALSAAGALGLGVAGLLKQWLDPWGKEGDWSSSSDNTPGTDWSSVGSAADTSIGEGDFSSADFSVGGVVPSAAGGMKVDDGKGGTLAIVHPNEMVLPANLSKGIQRLIGSGGDDSQGIPSADEGMVVPGDTSSYSTGAAGASNSTTNAFAQGTTNLQGSASTLQTAGTSLLTASQQLTRAANSGGRSGGGTSGIGATLLGAVGKIVGTVVGGPLGGIAGGAVGQVAGSELGFATGTHEVAQTGLAEIHQGEMVVPAAAAAEIRSGEHQKPFSKFAAFLGISGRGAERTPVRDEVVEASAKPAARLSPLVGSYDTGTREAPSSGSALVHEGETILSADQARDLRQRTEEALTEKTREFRGVAPRGQEPYAPTTLSTLATATKKPETPAAHDLTPFSTTKTAPGATQPLPASGPKPPTRDLAAAPSEARDAAAIAAELGAVVQPAVEPLGSSEPSSRIILPASATPQSLVDLSETEQGPGGTPIAAIHHSELTGLPKPQATAAPGLLPPQSEIGVTRLDVAPGQPFTPTTAIASTAPPGQQPIIRDFLGAFASGMRQMPADGTALVHRGEIIGPGNLGTMLGMMVNGRSGAPDLSGLLEAKLPHFELGAWEISHDMAGFLHRGETVVPSNYADGLRAAQSGGGGGDVNLHYSPTVNAPAQPTLESYLHREGQAMLGWINAQMRSGALRPPPG